VLAEIIAIVIAGLIALAGTHAVRNWHKRHAPPGQDASTPEKLIEGGVLVAPYFFATVVMSLVRATLSWLHMHTAVVDTALQLTIALIIVRFGMYLLRLSMGGANWVRAWENRLTVLIWLLVGFELLGWFDYAESTLDSIDLIPGKVQFSLWALLKAIVVVSVFGVAGVAHAAEKPNHAAKECIEKLEAGKTIDDCQESPNPILPETNELVWGGLAFVVLLGLMWKFGLPPVRKMMHDREDRIRGDLERAEQAKTEAESVLEDYRRQLAEARTEASQIIEASREQAEEVRRELIARAESDAAEVRQRAAEDARLASDRAMSELRASVATLSIELAEKVVERNLDHDTQIQLIESYINQVGSR